MEKTIKIPWDEFIKIAMNNLGDKYKGLRFVGEPKFKRAYHYGPDGEVYERPEYVEIEIE